VAEWTVIVDPLLKLAVTDETFCSDQSMSLPNGIFGCLQQILFVVPRASMCAADGSLDLLKLNGAVRYRVGLNCDLLIVRHEKTQPPSATGFGCHRAGEFPVIPRAGLAISKVSNSALRGQLAKALISLLYTTLSLAIRISPVRLHHVLSSMLRNGRDSRYRR
jgi:hypothetical protein